ncbi:MAG: hypothetical protein ISS80_00640 [Candidatus Cloacimonetes bacterium]|nr:hypothetical protein [Candidatus Cloacimonadota bacterium]
MKVINIKITNSEKELENKVLPLLLNHVFHVTTYSAYKNILKDKFIKPNKNELYKFNHPQSQISLGVKNNYICLVDLRKTTDLAISNSFEKFNFLHPIWSDELTVFMILTPNIYKNIIIQKQIKEKLNKEFYVPKIESWYPIKLSIKYIEKTIIVKIQLEREIKSICDAVYMRKLEKSREPPKQS